MNSSNQFFNLFLFYIEYGGVRGVGMCTRAQVPPKPKERIRSPGDGVTRVVSPLTWIMETELRSSVREACILNLRHIVPVLKLFFKRA